jgi:hypothetical protein
MVQMGLLGEIGGTDYIWRIAVEPDAGGDVVRVVLFAKTRDGVTRCFYEIPDAGMLSFIKPVAPAKPPGPGVMLPPATVTLRTDKLKKEDDKGKI